MNLLPDILHLTAGSDPERAAVYDNRSWVTYGELADASSGVASALQEMGLKPGERVGILWENSVGYISAHFGALQAGAVEVSLNTELNGRAVLELLDDCDVQFLFVSAKQLRRLLPDLPDARSIRHLITDAKDVPPAILELDVSVHRLSEMVNADGTKVPTVGRSPDGLASIVYTSGSTGRPKGVMLSHRNLFSNTQSIVQYLGLRADDRMMVVLPFHYIYGRSLMYTHFLSGGSIVLENRFAFPSVVVKAMEEQGITCFAGVPSTYSILLRKTDFARRQFPKMRLFTQAGGAMAPSVQRELVEAFPGVDLFVMYGSTEAAPRLTYLPPEQLPDKAGSIGRGIPGVKVIIADEQGNELPDGEVGEVAASGPNIMLGYWNDPDGTQAVLRNGYYFTGDLGYKDADGHIFLTGRSRDIIKPGGNRVSAKEIEEVILELPQVVEVAAVAVPDEVLGEAIKVFVVSNAVALSEASLLAHAASRLPGYKVPSHVEFTESLPKNSSGKIMKSKLTEGTISSH